MDAVQAAGEAVGGLQGPAPHMPGPSTGRALVLAWTISLGAHVALFAAMYSLTWLVGRPDRGELPVAHTELLDGWTRSKTTVSRQEPAFERVTTGEPLRFSPRKSDVSAAIAAASPLAGDSEDAGTGSGAGLRGGLDIIGLGGGGGGDLGKYGLDVGSVDPGPQFFGLGGKARGAKRIVYVVDRSGSMIETFDAVRKELLRSVDRLRRSQRFHVIFFKDGPPLENPPKKLVNASGDQKRSLAEFLDRVGPEGNTDPIPAMRRAFELGPDLIYFLTDGEFDPRLIEELRKRNPQKKVRIFTIAYVSQMGGTLLEQIARENNGEYRFVSEYDL